MSNKDHENVLVFSVHLVCSPVPPDDRWEAMEVVRGKEERFYAASKGEAREKN